MLPLAPGRFSTMTCCPSRAASGSPMTRALLSVTPPGAKGTMMRTGLTGYSCAHAGCLGTVATASSNRTTTRHFIITASPLHCLTSSLIHASPRAAQSVLAQQLHDALRRDRRRGYRPALPGALHAQRIQRRGRLEMHEIDMRHVGRERQQVFAEVGRYRLRVLVVRHAFVERIAHPVRDAPDDLAVHDHGIDHAA